MEERTQPKKLLLVANVVKEHVLKFHVPTIKALKARGWTVDVVPESLVWHIGGGTLPQESPFKLKLNFRNSLWMLRRNLPSTVGPARAFLKLTARRLLDWGSALVYLLGGRPDFAKAVVQAHRDASRRHIEPCGCTGPRPRVLSGKLILLNFLNR